MPGWQVEWRSSDPSRGGAGDVRRHRRHRQGRVGGAGLGNKFLANIRECDAICQVVRVFADDDVVHVDGRWIRRATSRSSRPSSILADLQTLEKAVPRSGEGSPEQQGAQARSRTGGSGVETSERWHDVIRPGQDFSLLRELNLLTTKPFCTCSSADESVLTDAARVFAELRELVAPADAVFPTPDRGRAARSSTTSPPPSCWSRSGRASVVWMRWRGRAFHTEAADILTAGPKRPAPDSSTRATRPRVPPG